MTHAPDPPRPPDGVPVMQRLFDNIWLLLAAGVAVMLVIYTLWGLWEVLTLPQATLP